MRRSDIWFFGVILFFLSLVIVTLFNKDLQSIGIFNHLMDYGHFYMWGSLLPFVFIKMTYIIFPQFKLNTRVFKWLNTDILNDED